MPHILALVTLALPLLSLTNTHGIHQQTPIDPNADWATRHMAEEHHISNFDASSFFTLHDFNSDGVWDVSEIKRFYGMEDESANGVSPEQKAEVAWGVLKLFDKNGDGKVDRSEWMMASKMGDVLPDFGLGPGHHGDDEYEYEIHHYEKYHDENTREEDLVHPEDIAHFKKHEQLEDAAIAQARLDKMTINEANIPDKFKRRL